MNLGKIKFMKILESHALKLKRKIVSLWEHNRTVLTEKYKLLRFEIHIQKFFFSQFAMTEIILKFYVINCNNKWIGLFATGLALSVILDINIENFRKYNVWKIFLISYMSIYGKNFVTVIYLLLTINTWIVLSILIKNLFYFC
jgi:hypothetical protein